MTTGVAPGCQFASDNAAGICPEAWNALAEANVGCVRGYGDDPWTQRAADGLRSLFETDCEVFFTFNGTAANSLALAALCQSYHSVIASDVAHIEVDECGGPEFFSNGSKLLIAEATAGKLSPEAVSAIVARRTDIHYPKPRALSLTQTTECGTVYTVDEITDLCRTARERGLNVHMDGARFANAVATLGVSPKEITWQAGVDVLCFGGTKNGMPVGDAVIFFRHDLAHEFDYRCKQAGQLASKMRFLAAPWVGMLEGNAWLRHAEHANQMAQRLEAGLSAIKEIELVFPREANAVFARLPSQVDQALKARGWHYYGFIAKGGARLMCSWATTPADVDTFLADVREALA